MAGRADVGDSEAEHRHRYRPGFGSGGGFDDAMGPRAHDGNVMAQIGGDLIGNDHHQIDADNVDVWDNLPVSDDTNKASRSESSGYCDRTNDDETPADAPPPPFARPYYGRHASSYALGRHDGDISTVTADYYHSIDSGYRRPLIYWCLDILLLLHPIVLAANITNLCESLSRWVTTKLAWTPSDAELPHAVLKKALAHNMITYSFAVPATQRRFNRFLATLYGFWHQLCFAVLPASAFVVVELYEAVVTWQTRNGATFVSSATLAATFAIACCFFISGGCYLYYVRQQSTFQSTVVVGEAITVQQRTEANRNRGDSRSLGYFNPNQPDGDDGTDLFTLMRRHDPETIHAEYILTAADAQAMQALKWGAMFYVCFIIWISAIPLFGVLTGVVPPQSCTFFCIDGHTPTMLLMQNMNCPLLLAAMMPLPFLPVMFAELVSKGALMVLIYYTGGYKNVFYITVIATHMSCFMGFIFQWIIFRQYVRIFVTRELQTFSAVLIQRNLVLTALRSERAPVLANDPAAGDLEDVLGQTFIRRTMEVQFNPYTLQFYNEDVQKRFMRMNICQYDFKSIMIALVIPVTAMTIMGAWQFFEFYFEDQNSISALHLGWSTCVFALQPALLILATYYHNKATSQLSVVRNADAAAICLDSTTNGTNNSQPTNINDAGVGTETARSNIGSDITTEVAISNTNTDNCRTNLATTVDIDRTITRLMWLSSLALASFAAGLATQIFAPMFLSHRKCDYYCIGPGASPAVPIDLIWLLVGYVGLIIAVSWEVAIGLEIVSKLFVIVILYTGGTFPDPAHHISTILLIVAMAAMSSCSVWTIFRLSRIVFQHQDTLARTAVEHEKQVISRNHIWHLV